MIKKYSLLTEFINILLICLIGYINFSSQSVSWVLTLISAIILTVIFTKDTIKKSIFYFAFTILGSFAVYYFQTDVRDTDLLLNTCIRILDLALPAFVLNLCLRSKKMNLGKVLYFTSGANLFVNLLSLTKIKYYDKINMMDTIDVFYNELIDTYKTVLSGNYAFNTINIDEIIPVFNIIKEITVMLIPAFLIILCMAVSYILIVATRGMLKVYSNRDYSNIEYFYQISVGRFLSTITLIFLIVALLFGSEYFVSAIYNFVFVACFIDFVNGVSVIYFFMIKKLRGLFAAKILTAVILILSLISVALIPTFNGISILFVIGLMDSTVNFRKLKKVGE